MNTHIERHGPGFYTISGYRTSSRRTDSGQILAAPLLCEIVFADEGSDNGVTPELLDEVIALWRAEKRARASVTVPAMIPSVTEEGIRNREVSPAESLKKRKRGRPRKPSTVFPDAAPQPALA